MTFGAPSHSMTIPFLLIMHCLIKKKKPDLKQVLLSKRTGGKIVVSHSLRCIYINMYYFTGCLLQYCMLWPVTTYHLQYMSSNARAVSRVLPLQRQLRYSRFGLTLSEKNVSHSRLLGIIFFNCLESSWANRKQIWHISYDAALL